MFLCWPQLWEPTYMRSRLGCRALADKYTPYFNEPHLCEIKTYTQQPQLRHAIKASLNQTSLCTT